MNPRVAISSPVTEINSPQSHRVTEKGKTSKGFLGDSVANAFVLSYLLRQFSAQQFLQRRRRAAHAHKELAEQRIHGADMVEAHLVDQLLEDQRIVGKQVDSPLPVVKANRAGDDLLYLACIAAAYQSVLAHLAGALFDRKRIPVLVFAAQPVHGIKTDVTVRRNLRKQPRTHRLPMPLKFAFDLRLPLVGVRLDALIGQILINFERRVIESEFD